MYGMGSAWDEAASFIQSLGQTGTQTYANILKAQQGQPITTTGQPQVQPKTDWNKILLYGGIAVGGVALVMWLMKRKK